MLKKNRKPNGKRRRSVRWTKRGLRIEHLESRQLLATVIVGNDLDVVNGDTTSIASLIASDGGDGIALREAVEAANSTIGPDVIEFAQPFFSVTQTIELSQGELVVSEPISLQGPGEQLLTVDAQQQSRIINLVSTTGDFTFSDLTLTGGLTTGDGFQYDDSGYGGGAIRSATAGTISFSSVTLVGNMTTGDYAHGGAVYARGRVELTDSTISGNSTTGAAAPRGGGISTSGAVALTDSQVTGNQTSGNRAHGGGIYAFGDITLDASSLNDNQTSGEGARGGGARSREGGFVVTRSEIRNNQTRDDLADGGGIFSRQDVVLEDSWVSGNVTLGISSEGGGVFTLGDLNVRRSTISGNITRGSGAAGGGLRSLFGHVTLENSTVSGNTASGPGSQGGGLLSQGQVTLKSSLFTDNRADRYGGGFWNINALVTIENSIVAGNTALDGNPDIRSTGVFAITHSIIGDNLGTTLVESQSPDAFGNVIGSSVGAGTIDPGLDVLQNNGGPTPTHALLPGSLALDAGDPSLSLGAPGVTTFDQRGPGFLRVTNQRIDIGPLEMQSSIKADFNDDGSLDLIDIDLLIEAIASGTADPATFDLTGDGIVDLTDRDNWLAVAGAINLPSARPYRLGDANLDGFVDGLDFVHWNTAKFTSGNNWTGADFNADGTTDGPDFVIWNDNKFAPTARALPQTPTVRHLQNEAPPSEISRRPTPPFFVESLHYRQLHNRETSQDLTLTFE